MNKLFRYEHIPDFAILIILIIGVLVGLIIYDDFGESWDEPLYYEYADSTIKAYSISDRLDGTYQYSKTLGPADLMYYGPAFLIVGEGVTALLSLVLPHALSIDIWHLTIYLSFLLSIFFFFKIARRWVSTLAATVTTLLFASQPVLFGNAWINPKDIPMMTLFIGTVYFGLIFLDHARAAFLGQKQQEKPSENRLEIIRGVRTKRQKTAVIISVVLLIVCLVILMGGDAIRSWIERTIMAIDIANPVSMIDKVFVHMAANAQSLPLDGYVNKAIINFNRLTGCVEVITILAVILSICLVVDSQLLTKIAHSIRYLLNDLKCGYSEYPHKLRLVSSFLIGCVFLGFACATRLAGGLAALMVIGLWIYHLKKKSIPLIGLYGLLSIVIFYICWPYIWRDTFSNILYVLGRMTYFPDVHAVMFAGDTISSLRLPTIYLPKLLVMTNSEPVILLFLVGVLVCGYRLIKDKVNRHELIAVLIWFFGPFFYVIIAHPPLYDNYRHFLFIIPAAFILCALAVDFLCTRIKIRWLLGLVMLTVLIPGFAADIQLHPYEYTYYNLVSGGVQGAAHEYEVDYWLTCYKELTEEINAGETEPRRVFVFMSPELVETYANSNLDIQKVSSEWDLPSGSLVILPLRWNYTSRYPDLPIEYAVTLDGVDLCVAKGVE